MRPRRKDERGRGPHLAPIRQRIESIFQTCKDILTLERHGARTLHQLRVRLATRFAALAAAIALNHRLKRPSRSLAAYTT
jgi:DDE family transposase